MTMAGQWYESGTLWTALGVAVAALGLAVSAWATLRANNPKRRLTYRLVSATPLVAPQGPVRDGLIVSRDGATLTDPHVLQIELGAVPMRVLRWGDSRGFGICMAGRVSTFGGESFAVGWTLDEGG
ncbi:hypothetical protein, partial [Streptomyces gibsoniae]